MTLLLRDPNEDRVIKVLKIPYYVSSSHVTAMSLRRSSSPTDFFTCKNYMKNNSVGHMKQKLQTEAQQRRVCENYHSLASIAKDKNG